MARLIHSENGTVVEVGEALADRYRATGWSDADAKDQQDEATSEKPQRRTRKPRNAE